MAEKQPICECDNIHEEVVADVRGKIPSNPPAPIFSGFRAV